MKTFKEHKLFTLFFFFAIFVFFFSLISMKASFLWGDNLCQFYPWFKCYSEAVKNFSLPYWIKSMGSGFPLMAEGQVGGFYPLNIIFFFFLPFKAAYNYLIILHFVIAGVFTYMYSRKIGSDEIGGLLSALLFCFGSAYAGCFYNIITLRTLAWFPLVLLLFENYFAARRYKYIFFSGIVLGCQFLAGFVQMAAYSAFFYLIYFIYRAASEKIRAANILYAVCAFLSAAFIISLPQLLLTFKLVLFCGRHNATLGFALWRSFIPSGLLGLVFPRSLSSINTHFYVGILSMLFVIFSFFTLKENKVLKAMVLILLLSLFLAIGWLNPLYVAFLRVTKFYFFRNPSKFLFFAGFALSVLAGYGFTKFFERNDTANKKKAINIFRIIILGAVTFFLIIKFILSVFSEQVLGLGHYFVKQFIYNKPHHRHTMDYYIDNLNSFYERIAASMSFSDIFTLFSWVFIIVSILVIPFLLKRKMRFLSIFVIFLDLFTFSFYGIGFGENIRSFSYVEPDNREMLEILKKDKGIYRILPFGLRSEKLPNWARANANVIYNLDSVACYTPLANDNYRKKLMDLEVVDDSLGLNDPSMEAIGRNMEIVKLLNVGYVVSDKALSEGLLEKVFFEKGIYLYRVKGTFPRAFFSYGIDKKIEPALDGRVKINRYEDGFLSLQVSADRDGFVIFSENYYPGWRVFVDGLEKDLIKVKGFLQGVAVKKGNHRIDFICQNYTL